jgi:hypothetical protein
MRPKLIHRFAGPVFALFVLAFSAPAGSAGAWRFIDYVYIDASEGSASGGHTAIKFDDEVFHFQHVPPGLLRARRDDFGGFRHQYGDLENRTIHIHRVEVSQETYGLLRDAFVRRLLIQDEQFEVLHAIGRDLSLLEYFLSRSSGDRSGDSMEVRPLQLKGIGLFYPDGWNWADRRAAKSNTDVSPPLAALRARMEERHGPDFLRAKADEIRARLRALQPSGFDPKSIVLSEDRFSPAGYSYAGRCADLTLALAALDILDRGLPVRAGALLRPSFPEFRLNSAEAEELANFRRRLEADLLRLIDSDRPDWGFPLLIGMARLIALDASIASGRLVFLNRLREEEGDTLDGALRQVLFDQARNQLVTERTVLKGGIALDERAYIRLENAANRFLALRSAMQAGKPFRSPAAAGMNSAMVEPIPPAVGRTRLSTLIGQAKNYREAYELRLRALYRYDLIGRNCVSEIFRVIDGALAGQPGGSGRADAGETESRARSESIRRLGGYVGRESLNFIPFVSFRTVGAAYRVAQTLELPSYRRRRLDRDYARENPVLVGLRESNVLSSTLYRWHRGDSAFLFFTDDAVWLRPIEGGANVLVALGQGMTGLATLPWDSGKNLRQGAKGLLMSLPELLFFNIRKGSYPVLPWSPSSDAL